MITKLFKAQKNEILQIKFDSKYFYSCTRKGFKGWTLKSLVSGKSLLSFFLMIFFDQLIEFSWFQELM